MPTCFIAMPITTHPHEVERYGGDDAHWEHVMHTIFAPAVSAAGFTPILPVASGSHMIHGQIIKHLSTADIVLCDLSGHNPNVFFELGVRTSLNLPIALVRDEHTSIPFDTSGLNTHQYAATLQAWDTAAEVTRLADHLKASAASCAGSNPMWRHFGLTISAERPATDASSTEAKIELIFDGMNDLRREVGTLRAHTLQEEFGRPSRSIASAAGRLGRDLSPILRTTPRSGRQVDEHTFELRLHKNQPIDLTSALHGQVVSIANEYGFEPTDIHEDDESLVIKLELLDE